MNNPHTLTGEHMPHFRFTCIDGDILHDRHNNVQRLANYSSLEEARTKLLSNIDCVGCLNCANCTRCTDCHVCFACTDCTRCSGCDDSRACIDCSYCRACQVCEDCTEGRKLTNERLVRGSLMYQGYLTEPFPRLDFIHQRVYNAVLASPQQFNMNYLAHPSECGTVRCRAGWLIHLTPGGQELTDQTSWCFAARMIYKASGCPISPCSFYTTDEQAMQDMRAMAEHEIQTQGLCPT